MISNATARWQTMGGRKGTVVSFVSHGKYKIDGVRSEQNLVDRVETWLDNRKEELKAMGKPVVHFEIGCRDRGRAEEFYSKLFEWRIERSGPASMIDTAGQGGINGHITALGHEPHNYVTVYVQVDDLQTYLDRAGALGGRTLVPPVEVPGAGSFAWLADPDGNTIGLWKPKQA